MSPFFIENGGGFVLGRREFEVNSHIVDWSDSRIVKPQYYYLRTDLGKIH